MIKDEITLLPCQTEFVMSEARFCCFKAGIGVGKTFSLLFKIVMFCKRNANATALVVRKEYTDLRDSTIIDFRRYFGTEPNSSRDVNFDNGSKIMFRHAGEIEQANLKNMSLDIVGIEQAEELDSDEPFTYLRDRMRGTAHPGGLQQINLICNANGHNWVWRRWKYEPESPEFHIIEAVTFDNEKNLPKKFIEDMRAREKSEPKHFARMCMNSDDESLSDDNVFSSQDLLRSSKLGFSCGQFVRYAAGLDVGRYGSDSTCLTILARCGVKRWKQVFMEERHGWGAPAIVGWVKDMWSSMPFETLGIDDIGVGGGCADYLNDSGKFTTYGFITNEKPNGNSIYPNKKSEMIFKLEEYIAKEWLEISPDIYLHEELMSIRFFYRGESVKYIVSKDEMRAKGSKSPNKAEALGLALFYADENEIADWDSIPDRKSVV